MTVAAVAALVGCWVAAVQLRRTASLPGARFDAAWSARIDAHHTPTRDLLAHALAVIGGPPIGILITLAVAAVILRWRGWRAGVTVVAAAGLSECNVLVLKWVSERRSPTGSLYLGALGSFPSGHTANAAVIVVSIGFLADNLLVWATGAAYVAAMGLDRVYLDAHWVTDTIAGAIAGSAVAALTWYVAGPDFALLGWRGRRRAADAGFAVASSGGGSLPPDTGRQHRDPS